MKLVLNEEQIKKGMPLSMNEKFGARKFNKKLMKSIVYRIAIRFEKKKKKKEHIAYF